MDSTEIKPLSLESDIHQKQFASEAERAFVNLIYTVSWFQNRFQAYLKPRGLTPQQYNILRILRGQQGNPLPLNAVKARMLERNSDTSRIIDRMVRKGLIDRKTCKDDRRQVDLTLTPAGYKLLDSVGLDLDPVIGSLHCLSDAEQTSLNTILDKLRYEACESEIEAAKRKRQTSNT